MTKTSPCKYDNCKDCKSSCIHAGQDREFICINGVSCKVADNREQEKKEAVAFLERLAGHYIDLYMRDTGATKYSVDSVYYQECKTYARERTERYINLYKNNYITELETVDLILNHIPQKEV